MAKLKFAGIAALTLSVLLSATSVLGAGWWDSTFDSDGFATLSFTNFDDNLLSTAVQSDGKVVAVGLSQTSSSSPNNNEWAIARFNANGTLDSSFGTGGKVRPTLTTGSDVLRGVALQSDGKIVVVGNTQPVSNTYQFTVGRLNSDGTFDTTFDSDGLANLGAVDSYAFAVAIQPDQKIVVAGKAKANIADTTYDLVLARFESNGALDSTFGTSGVVTTQLSSSDETPASVLVQSDGKIVVAAYGGPSSSVDSYVLRYTSSGVLDTSFSSDGIEPDSLGSGSHYARGLTIQGDGKLLVVGQTYVGSVPDSFVARYNTTGTPDSTFGTSGISVFAFSGDWENTNGVVHQPDGKINLFGSVNKASSNHGFIARLLADGSVDPSFGCSGLETRLEGTSTIFSDGELLSGGQIVVGGYIQSSDGTGRNFAVAQFDPSIARPTACSGSSTSTTSTSTSTTSTSTTTTTTLA
ncbi:MAG: hypothetical protein ACKOFD_06960, partial [Actinomycetota bacterium]